MSILRISKAANVSYATAWRIINNRPCRSEEAVRAVRAAMEKFGYTPAGGRRGRRPKAADGIRTHNVALLHLRAGSTIGASVLSCVQQMLAQWNLNLIFAQVDRGDSMPQAVRSGNVDGILGYGEFPSELAGTNLRRIPAVWMMSRSAADGHDAWGDRVKPDHEAIGRMAAEHLVGRGHKDLAYFNPRPGRVMYAERGVAFKSSLDGKAASLAMLSADLGKPEANDAEGKEIAAEQFVQQWKTLDPRPTGVFVPVDRVTLRVYRHLQQHGFVPGRDVEVVSCDNEADLLALMTPSPASLDLNRQAIARLAVERLLWRMKNGTTSPAVCITVSPTLVTERIPTRVMEPVTIGQ